MNTQENNKIIAEFMGITPNEAGVYHVSKHKGYSLENLLYHTSWDWLMPVVEGMESMGYNVSIMRRCWVVVFDTNVMKEIVSIERRASKLEVTHEAVVEFIKQYNK